MFILFLLLFVVSIVLLIIGLIRPNTIFWSKTKSRKTAILYLVPAFIFMIIGGMVSPTRLAANAPASSTSDSEAMKTIASQKAASEPEQHGTSEYADYLHYKGEADAENATDAQIKEASDYIYSNLDDLTKDKDTMEKIIYYGSFLEHSSKDAILQSIGVDAEQAVKYQYRGKTDSDEVKATKENQSQLIKGFNKYNSSTSK